MTRNDSKALVSPDENLNWADYVDALMHQDSGRHVLISEKITGRRLRDRFRDEVTRDRLIHPLSEDQ
jgi:hypothetical protein